MWAFRNFSMPWVCVLPGVLRSCLTSAKAEDFFKSSRPEYGVQEKQGLQSGDVGQA